MSASVQRVYPVIDRCLRQWQSDLLVVPLTERLAFCYRDSLLFLSPQRALLLFQKIHGPVQDERLWSLLLDESARQRRVLFRLLICLLIVALGIYWGLSFFAGA